MIRFRPTTALSKEALETVCAVPGVWSKGGNVFATDDCEPAVSKLLGVGPVHRDAPVRYAIARPETVRGYEKLWPFQKDDSLKLATGVAAGLWSACGCLIGPTKVTINRGGKGKLFELGTVVRRLLGEPVTNKRNGRLLRPWDPSIPTQIQSVDAEGYLRLSPIVGVYRAGNEPVFKLASSSGRTIYATEKHGFLTPDGWRGLGTLRPGDEVMIAQWPARGENPEVLKQRYLMVQGLFKHPYAVRWQDRRHGDRHAAIPEHRLVMEAQVNGLSYCEFVGRVFLGRLDGLRFLDPAVEHVHHRNRNTFDNDPNNLEVLPYEEHARLHGTEGGWKHVAGRVAPDRVVSIEDAGKTDVFDLTVADTHCYVADGFAVHNTGKTSIAMAALDLARLGNSLVVTKSIGRESWARDTVWIGNRRCAVVVGRLGTDHGEAAARRANRLFRRYRDAGADVIAVNDAQKALADGYNLIVVGWETLAVEEKNADGKTIIRPRPDLNVGWSGLVFDEHHLGKGRLSDRTLAAFTLARQASRVWSLTATPVADRLRDLWPQLHSLHPKAWGKSDWKFVHRYAHAREGQYGGLDTTGPFSWCDPNGDRSCTYCQEALAELKERLTHYFVVRTRDVIRDALPPKRRERIHIPSSKAAASVAAGAGLRAIEGALAVAADVATEAAVDVAAETLINGSGKVVIVGNRVAWVPKAARMIERAVSKVRRIRESLWIREATGAVPAPQRRAWADEFVKRRGPACIVATIEAVCESLDLQDADALLCCAVPWTPKQVTQLEGRVSRIGQGRPVIVYYFIPEGTIAEQIEATLLSKLAAVEGAGADTEKVNFDPLEGLSEDQVIAQMNEWLSAGPEAA